MRMMTATQLNADILQNLGVIANDENALKRVAKYLRKVAKELTSDPTLMTKEDFFARIDKAKEGPSYSMLPDEDLKTFLRRLGHEI
jgi:hypothetical protein